MKCLLGLFFVFALAISGFGQTEPSLPSANPKPIETNDVRTAKEAEARQAVSKSVLADIFLDKVTVKDADWKLKKADHTISGGDENKATTILSFEKNSAEVHIRIAEFNSEGEALEHSKTPRSGGISVNFNTYGDEGEKIFIYGNFVLLHFRKGSVFVTVGGTDEKTAERFAGYVAESLAN